MTRKNTEKTEAETRKEDQAEAEELATDEHGTTRKQNKSFRAGCVSDGWTPSHPQ